MELYGEVAERQVALPTRPITRIMRPFERFLHIEAVSGVVLLLTTLFALGFANSELAVVYEAFWDQTARIGVGAYELAYPLWYWVNDGLMTLFFFVIGLEIKREVVHGELKEPSAIILPVSGAVGGAVVPVIIFLALLGDGSGRLAWAVPMATDIAFVVGCLALFGNRVPRGLKILMLSLAIVDDILAVLVIALFYTSTIDLGWVVLALSGFAVIVGLNRLGVRTLSAYVGVGSIIWLCTLKSGIHPTVAGVALGLLAPASAWVGHGSVGDLLEQVVGRIRGTTPNVASTPLREAVAEAAFVTREAISPLERLERGLHPWVAFAIMPVFALANAGVAVSADSLAEPLSLAIAVGLFVGKPTGIALAAWLSIRLGLSRLPTGTSWSMVIGAGFLAGIGFTMALFVASLGLQDAELAVAKGGVLLGSCASLLVGMGLLYMALGRAPETE